MADFVVKDPPEYNDKMRMLETTDPAHADVFNALFMQLVNNDAFVKRLAGSAVQKIEGTSQLKNDAGWLRILKFNTEVFSSTLTITRGTAHAGENVTVLISGDRNNTESLSATLFAHPAGATYINGLRLTYTPPTESQEGYFSVEIKTLAGSSEQLFVKLFNFAHIGGQPEITFMSEFVPEPTENSVPIHDMGYELGKALETAVGAMNTANKAEPNREDFTNADAAGWYRIFSFPATLTSTVFQVSLCKNRRHEASEAASFLVSYSYDNVEGREKANISQLVDVSYLPMIKKVRLVLVGEVLYFDFYYSNNNAAKIIYSIKPFTADIDEISYSTSYEPEIPESATVFERDVINNVGIVADRAIATKSGNDILPQYKFRFDPVTGWNRVIRFTSISWVQFQVNVSRVWGNNPPETMSFVVGAASHDSMAASINQLNHTAKNALMMDKVRITYDTDNRNYFFDVHACAGNPIQVEVFNFSDEGELFFIGEEITAIPTQVLEYDTTNICGIIADKAMTVEPSVFTNHQVVSTYGVTTNEEIDIAINHAYDNATNVGYFEFILASNAPGLALSGGRWYFQGYKDSDVNYGWIEGKTYIIGDSKVKRVKNNGIWSDWFKESFATHAVAVQHIIKTESELESLIDYIYGSVSNDSVFETMLSVGTSDVSIAGGLWYLSGFKHNNDFGYYEVKKYGTGSDPRMQYKSRSKQNGTWGGWVTISS